MPFIYCSFSFNRTRRQHSFPFNFRGPSMFLPNFLPLAVYAQTRKREGVIYRKCSKGEQSTSDSLISEFSDLEGRVFMVRGRETMAAYFLKVDNCLIGTTYLFMHKVCSHLLKVCSNICGSRQN